MAKRRSRIAYVPRSSRRHRSSITKNQSPSTSAQEGKETTYKKRRKNEQQPTKQKPVDQEAASSVSEAAPGISPQKTSRQGSTKAQGIRKRKGTNSQRNEESTRISERIRDMTVTRKAYVKWKPLSESTKIYTKQVVESVVLSVLNSVGHGGTKRDLQAPLKQLSDRIIARLGSMKGPPHKGDYSKMEAESNELEDAVISYNQQIEGLERELEEQKRLLEIDEQTLNSLYEQDQEEEFRTQLHPLLQSEAANALNLPSLTQDAFHTPILEVPVELEVSGRRLAQSLTKLSQQTEQLGFTRWLEATCTSETLDS